MRIPYFLHPPMFIIQWHLTERCNWHCKHCYRDENHVEELPFKFLKDIFMSCLELFEVLHIPKDKARINIGGGEPFLRGDFFKFLSLLNNYRDLFRVSIMTNGSLIDNEVARDLSRIEVVKGVQLSLEGLEDVNDAIRGKGAFNKTLKAIRLLKKNNISIRVSLTLTKQNLSEVEDLAIYLKGIGVSDFGIRRYVPIGRGEQLKKYMLSPLELKDFYLKRKELKRRFDEIEKFTITYGCEDGIFFAQNNHSFHNCGVVRGHHLNIAANGDVLACRRFPMRVGNALKGNLLDIHFSSEQLQEYRNLNNAHSLCKKCVYFKYCLGGAMCVRSAYFGTSFAPDPQCWRLFKKLSNPDMFGDEKKYAKKESSVTKESLINMEKGGFYEENRRTEKREKAVL